MSSIAPPCHTRAATTSDDWITPRWLLEALPSFDLDVCASKTQPWPCAKRAFTERENGLLMPWEGFVWCNPPYGKQATAWLDRMSLHNNGVALVFARTETRMFFDHVWKYARHLLFLRGRVTFCRPDGNPAPQGHNSGGPSVLIGYGQRGSEALIGARELGALIFVTADVVEEAKHGPAA